MIRRPLTALLAAAAVVAIGLLALPRIMPDDYTRRQLARALERETGIQLEQADSIHLALFPRLGIVLEQVTLRMPELGALPPISAERVVADVDPWALFERRLHLKRLLVERPSMTFQVNASSRSIWDFGEAPREPKRQATRLAALGGDTPIAEAVASPMPTLRSRRPRLPTAEVDIQDGSFTYLDETRGRRIEVSAFSIALKSDRSDGAASLDGSFRLAGEEVRVKAALREQISLSEPTSPLRVEIGSRAGSVVFDGVANWKDERNLRGQTRLDLTSGAALHEWLGDGARSLARLEKASLGGMLIIDNQHASLNDARLQTGEATGDLDLAVDFDGRGRFNLNSLFLYGGRATGRITVDARQHAAVIAGTFEMSDVDSMALFKRLSGFDWISGRSNATLHIAGGGESLAAVLGTLTGEGALSVTDGAIEGLDLPALIAKAREGEFKPWRRREGQRTRFDTLTSAFTLDKGIARSSELALTGPDIAATGEGEANIPSQSLDYRLKVKVQAATEEERARAEDGQVEVPLILRGPWDKPDIYPDLDKVLRDPKALNDAARVIGKSVEKFTEGKIKSEDINQALESLFGGKKKKKSE
jgi:uncharacterized protein involved in outer membrane biogenesis